MMDQSQITVEQVHAMQTSGEDFFLLDCREPHEIEICMIEGAYHIPMRQTPARLDELPRDKPIVVYCHGGIRSDQVAQFLRQHAQLNALNMTGGIHAWSLQIDPTVPTY